MEDKNNKTGIWKGYIFAVAMFATGVLQSSLLEYHFHVARMLEMKIKSAIIGLIYEKVHAMRSAILEGIYTYFIPIIRSSRRRS